MDTNVLNVMTKEREAYLACFAKGLAEHREISPQAVAELLIEINTQKIPLPYRYIRPDIIYKIAEESKIIEVNKNRHFSFDPYVFTTPSGIPATLHPFHWNGIEFRLFGDIVSWEPYDDWIRTWLDLEDLRSREGKDFQCVIHNATEPKRAGGFWELSIDMGSAELDALSDLFSVFAELGFGTIEIGSFSLIPPGH